MLYILVAILVFGLLIATHELGHFASAKLLGVKVNEFSVGMGPAIFSRERGEGCPLIIAGGPCAVNPEPIAAFFDAVVTPDTITKKGA